MTNGYIIGHTASPRWHRDRVSRSERLNDSLVLASNLRQLEPGTFQPEFGVVVVEQTRPVPHRDVGETRQALQQRVHHTFALKVQGRRCLIQNGEPRRVDQQPRKAQALLLPEAEHGTPISLAAKPIASASSTPRSTTRSRGCERDPPHERRFAAELPRSPTTTNSHPFPPSPSIPETDHPTGPEPPLSPCRRASRAARGRGETSQVPTWRCELCRERASVPWG